MIPSMTLLLASLAGCGGTAAPESEVGAPDPSKAQAVAEVPDQECGVPEGWPELAEACAKQEVRPLTPGCEGAPELEMNLLTGRPYTDEDAKLLAPYAILPEAARLVPGTKDAEFRRCVEMPHYRKSMIRLRSGSAPSPQDLLNFHCPLVRDLAARTALARAIVDTPQSESLPRVARLSKCKAVSEEQRRILKVYGEFETK